MKKIGIGGYRLCPVCKTKLKKNGLSKNGAQRWYCKKCQKSFVLNKKIKQTSSWKINLKLFIKYLLDTQTIKALGFTRTKFERKVRQYRYLWIPELVDIKTFTKVMYLDAIYFSNQCSLIARNNDVVIGWKFCPYENADYWYEFIRLFPAPLHYMSFVMAIKD